MGMSGPWSVERLLLPLLMSDPKFEGLFWSMEVGHRPCCVKAGGCWAEGPDGVPSWLALLGAPTYPGISREGSGGGSHPKSF